MQPNRQEALIDINVQSSISIPARHIEKAVARDMGWERLMPANSFPLMLGMDDVLATERDMARLVRGKSLTLDERDFLTAASLHGQKLPLGVGWYWRVTNLLRVAWPMVRLSEPVQWVYELAREKGYLDESGRLLPAADILLRPAPDSIRLVQEFLQALRVLYSSGRYRDALRHRHEQAEHNLEQHLLLLDYYLVKYGRFRAIALDFSLDQKSTLGGIHHGYFLDNVVQCRGHFFNNLRFSPFFREGGIGYLWHLSFHSQRGYYIRTIFFMAPDGLGGHEKFHARASRLWSDVTNGLGSCTDCRKHPNELARVGWMVDASNEKSVKRMDRALVYQIEKDKRFRIVTPDKRHVFGHTEMAGLEPSMLESAWGRLYAASSSMGPALLASQQQRLRNLQRVFLKRSALRAGDSYIGSYAGVVHHAP